MWVGFWRGVAVVMCYFVVAERTLGRGILTDNLGFADAGVATHGRVLHDLFFGDARGNIGVVSVDKEGCNVNTH